MTKLFGFSRPEFMKERLKVLNSGEQQAMDST